MTPDMLLLLQAWWKVINEERIGSWLQQTEHISGHLWHRYTMNSAQPLGTLGSVASMLAATFYQWPHDRNQKHWNIWLTERYIHHMQVLLVLSCPFIRQGTCICILNWTLCRALICLHANHHDETFLPRQICTIKKSI